MAGRKDPLDRHAGTHVLIICDAGIVRMTMAYILDIPLSNFFRIKVGHGQITRIKFLGQIVFHGKTL